MTIPQIESGHFARTHLHLKEAIDEALQIIELPVVAFFFSVTTKRGKELWSAFRAFQNEYGVDEHGGKYSFADYIIHVVDAIPIERAFMPHGCRKPYAIARLPTMQKLVDSLRHVSRELTSECYPGRLSDEEILIAFLEEVYFGRDELYALVRERHCRQCQYKNCGHHPQPL